MNRIKRCKKCNSFLTSNNECNCHYDTYNARREFAKQYPVAAAESAFDKWREWCKVVNRTGGLRFLTGSLKINK